MERLPQGKTVDITPLFKEAGIEVPPLSIVETPAMYPYKERVEDNWAYFTAAGLKRLKHLLATEGREVRDAGIIGICSGVEGIALVQVFRDTLRRLTVTDVDGEILKGTVVNIRNGTENVRYELTSLLGSFCEPIEAAGEQVDLVHGNIPNLPSTGEEDLSQGAEKGTFLPTGLYEGYDPPDEYVGWALGAQYAYLRSAENVLRDGGSLVTELGGRVPLDLVRKLFAEGGLRSFQEVVVGFKEQTEALMDFLGYHRMEKQYGVSFDFYRYDESKELLERYDIANPTWRISGSEMKELLAACRVSAGEALDLHRRGVPVGHTVHLFRGVK